MRNTISKAIVAGVAALSLATAVVATAEPASAAQWHGGGWGGGWHGGGWHGGGWGGGGRYWHPGYWRGGTWYGGWWGPAVVAGALAAGALATYPYWGNGYGYGGGECWQVRPVYSASGVWLGNRPVHVLGLAAVPVRRHDHPAGDGVSYRAALFLADQVEAGIDASCGARAGQHRVSVHVQHRRINLRGRVHAREAVRVTPVRSAATAIKQAGRTQHERTGAHAEHPASPLDGAPQRR